MATVVMLGPNDHGRAISREGFEAARAQEGYRYELIEGRVYVSPLPNLPHELLGEWLADLLKGYRQQYPTVVTHVARPARVIVPDTAEATNPEPDLAVYNDMPRDLPFSEYRWDDYSPFLVVEILSEDNPEKDLERNLELYLQVPSIREYWIIDPRADPDQPSLRVYRRRGSRWQRPLDIAAGETYTTRLLPGFTLELAPHL